MSLPNLSVVESKNPISFAIQILNKLGQLVYIPIYSIKKVCWCNLSFEFDCGVSEMEAEKIIKIADIELTKFNLEIISKKNNILYSY